MKYTAEEVREWAAFAQAQGKLYAPMKGAHEPWEKLEAMLTAYAARIEADEGAALDGVVPTVVSAACDAYTSRDPREQTVNRACMRAALLAVWPNPPAQAAQAEEWKSRALLAEELCRAYAAMINTIAQPGERA